jgi:hypothetical protein
MITYKNKEFSSKAEAVRYAFDAGIISMNANEKKAIAKELGMTPQTVHATLVKHTGVIKISKPEGEVKVKAAKTQAIKKATNAVTSGNVVYLNDKDKEVQDILKSQENKHRFKVTNTPNPWGLPVTDPYLEVIDERFTQKTLNEWKPGPDEKIVDGLWEE